MRARYKFFESVAGRNREGGEVVLNSYPCRLDEGVAEVAEQILQFCREHKKDVERACQAVSAMTTDQMKRLVVGAAKMFKVSGASTGLQESGIDIEEGVFGSVAQAGKEAYKYATTYTGVGMSVGSLSDIPNMLRSVSDFLSVWTLKIFNAAKNPKVIILAIIFLGIMWVLQANGIFSVTGDEFQMMTPNNLLSEVEALIAKGSPMQVFTGHGYPIHGMETSTKISMFSSTVSHWYNSGFFQAVVGWGLVFVKYAASAFTTVAKVAVPMTAVSVGAKAYLQKRADELKKGVVVK